MLIAMDIEAVAARAPDIKALKSDLRDLKRDLRTKEKEERAAIRAAERARKALAKVEERIAKYSDVAAPSAATAPVKRPRKTAGPIDLKDHPKFNRKLMQGPEWFATINGNSVRRAKVEGYWRPSFNKGLSSLPFPVIMTVKGYNKTAFVNRLQVLQRQAKKTIARGDAPNRWTGGSSGAAEYALDGWRWPGGLSYYLSAGVPPSRAFYKFVMGKDLLSLPTYGRA